MKKKLLTIIVAAITSLMFLNGADLNNISLELPGVGQEALDGSPYINQKDALVRKQRANGNLLLSSLRSSRADEAAVIGTKITLAISDSYKEEDYDETFVVTKVGAHGIILVTEDAYESFDGSNYYFSNPYGTGGEGFDRKEDILTTAQLEYMLKQFDDVIYPGDTKVFGEPEARGAEGKKVWILLHNIRDDAYYAPADETSYIAGYFSAGEDLANNKNMMHIDSYDWANRVGPDGERPHMYEGTFAHEFQHLIHFDRDADEPSWMDEACADLAGYICGYGHPSGHILYYLAYHPITPLTFWGSDLQDYGASYLFALYLYEKFGQDQFITALVNEQANGIEGLEATLEKFGYDLSFEEVFDRWTIANYLDDPQIMGGWYGYETLEIGSDDTRGYTISTALEKIWKEPLAKTPLSLASNRYNGADPRPYTAQYTIYQNEKFALLDFDGDDYAGVPSADGENQLYSGVSAWAWKGYSQTFNIPASGATLNFKAYYDIEENWDYAYVEVYDYDTNEWSTVKADGITVDTFPNIQDNPNVDPINEPETYLKAGKWNAFTGKSDGWIDVSMDLSLYAGHKIDLIFRTWQDGAFTLQMMRVDAISIPEIGFNDSLEDGEGKWTNTGWTVTDGKEKNGFTVTNLKTFTVPDELKEEAEEEKNIEILLNVRKTCMNPETQSGKDIIFPAHPDLKVKNITIITNHASHILSSHSELKIEDLY